MAIIPKTVASSGGFASADIALRVLAGEDPGIIPWRGDDCVPETQAGPDLSQTGFIPPQESGQASLSLAGSFANDPDTQRVSKHPLTFDCAAPKPVYQPSAAALEGVSLASKGALSDIEKLRLQRVINRVDLIIERLNRVRQDPLLKGQSDEFTNSPAFKQQFHGYPAHLKEDKPYLAYYLSDQLENLLVLVAAGNTEHARILLNALAQATQDILAFYPAYLEIINREMAALSMAQPGLQNLAVFTQEARRRYDLLIGEKVSIAQADVSFSPQESAAWRRAKTRIELFIHHLKGDLTPSGVEKALIASGFPREGIRIGNFESTYQAHPEIRASMKAYGDSEDCFINADEFSTKPRPGFSACSYIYINTKGKNEKCTDGLRMIQLFGRWACEQEGLTIRAVKSMRDGKLKSNAFESLRFYQLEICFMTLAIAYAEELGASSYQTTAWMTILTKIETDIREQLEQVGIEFPDNYTEAAHAATEPSSAAMLRWCTTNKTSLAFLDVMRATQGTVAYRYTPREVAAFLNDNSVSTGSNALIMTSGGDGRELTAVLPYTRGGKGFMHVTHITDSLLGAKRAATLAERFESTERTSSYFQRDWWSALPEKTHSFIFETELLEEIAADKRSVAIQKIAGSLVSGGQALMHLFLDEGDFFEAMKRMTGTRSGTDISVQSGAFRRTTHFFNLNEIKMLLRKAGLENNTAFTITLEKTTLMTSGKTCAARLVIKRK